MEFKLPHYTKQAGFHVGLRVLDTDVTPSGLIITFSDGLTALYRTEFLYMLHDHDDNVPLLKPRREASLPH